MSTSANGNGTVEPVVIAVTLIETSGQGWVADAVEICTIAQGETEAEALSNLQKLLRDYPELLDEVRAANSRKIELVAV